MSCLCRVCACAFVCVCACFCVCVCLCKWGKVLVSDDAVGIADGRPLAMRCYCLGGRWFWQGGKPWTPPYRPLGEFGGHLIRHMPGIFAISVPPRVGGDGSYPVSGAGISRFMSSQRLAKIPLDVGMMNDALCRALWMQQVWCQQYGVTAI